MLLTLFLALFGALIVCQRQAFALMQNNAIYEKFTDSKNWKDAEDYCIANPPTIPNGSMLLTEL